MQQPFRLLRAEGSSFDVGLVHGREAGDLVELSVELYRSLFKQVAGLEWPQVEDLARRLGKNMEGYDPELWAELEGIAEGSGQPLETIVALNARTDILRLAGKELSSVKLDGCTAAACLPGATADGHVLLGQNWDTSVTCLETTVMLSARIPGQPDVLVLTEAGIVARSGLNSHGVGVTGNALRCDQDYAVGLGVPVSFLRRRMLRHATMAGAVDEVVRSRRTHANNHLVASAEGDAVSLEAAPKGVYPVAPRGGILVHANHFLSPEAARQLADHTAQLSPDSFHRQSRVQSYLESRRGQISVEDLQHAFRDHDGFPGCVCRHPRGSPEGNLVGTVASIIMDLTARRLWVAKGPICENGYAEYTLP